MKHTFKILLVLAALAALVYFYAPARLFAIAITGRNSVCPFGKTLRVDADQKSQIQYKDRILQASKMLQEDPAGFQLWDTPHGRYWIPNGSEYVLPFNLAEQERKIYGRGDNAVSAGNIVLDCGANVGVYTRESLLAGAKTVVAIEPAPENIECLRRNFKDEIASGRVILYPKGVWDKEDFMSIQIDPHNSAADSFIIHRQGGIEGAKVPLTPIDKMVEELKLERVDYIKMDIEGAEQRALTGAKHTLARYHPRMAISSYHAPSDPQRIPAIIFDAWNGYKMECGPCAETAFRVRPDILYFK